MHWHVGVIDWQVRTSVIYMPDIKHREVYFSTEYLLIMRAFRLWLRPGAYLAARGTGRCELCEFHIFCRAVFHAQCGKRGSELVMQHAHCATK
jgi:hypothetical protein